MKVRRTETRGAGTSPDRPGRGQFLDSLREAIVADEDAWLKARTRRAEFSRHVAAGNTLEAWEAYTHYTADLRALAASNRRTWDAMGAAMERVRQRS
ncbi:MAG: hypothetical protein JWL73_216 [Actinomycetia bacterium]|nr:hypothetical protein [Actinomycetes bacterium]